MKAERRETNLFDFFAKAHPIFYKLFIKVLLAIYYIFFCPIFLFFRRKVLRLYKYITFKIKHKQCSCNVAVSIVYKITFKRKHPLVETHTLRLKNARTDSETSHM